MSLPTPYYDESGITIYHADCREILPLLEPGSVDLVLTDPPYGIQIDKQTKWDNPLSPPDIARFTDEVRRVATDFYAFFGQLPSALDWIAQAANARLHFCEHVVWVKRTATPMHRLNRSHESIFVYAVGKHRRFYETTGPYEDVKLPGVLVDVVSLEGIDRHIKDLRIKASGRSPTPVRGVHKQEAWGGKYADHYETDRSPEVTNFTNVWSFLPPGQKQRGGQPGHPTEKPLDLVTRLISMLSGCDGLILDPYMGSGTTLRAAKDLGRRAIGIEVEERYCEISVQRLAQQVLPLEMAV